MPRIEEYPSQDPMADDDLFVTHNQASGATRSVSRDAALRSLPDDSVKTDAIEDGAVDPSKRSGGFFIGSMAGSTFSTTGNKPITGVGFRPKLVRFAVLSVSASSSSVGYGAMAASGQWFLSHSSDGSSGARNGATTACIVLINSGGGVVLRAESVSLDADGFTINVTSASGAFSVAYECYA